MTVQSYYVSRPQHGSSLVRALMFAVVCLATSAAVDTFVFDGRSLQAISHEASAYIHRLNAEFRYWINNTAVGPRAISSIR
jgi:hypothetical protein